MSKNILVLVLYFFLAHGELKAFFFPKESKSSLKDSTYLTFVPQKAQNDKMLGDSLSLFIIISEYPYYPLKMLATDILVNKTYDVKGGDTVKITIRGSGQYSYMWLGYNYRGHVMHPFYNMSHVYMLKKGDNVRANLFENRTLFSGNAKARLNCMASMYSHSVCGEVFPRLLRNGHFRKAMEWQRMSYDTLQNIRLRIAEKARRNLSVTEYKLLRSTSYSVTYFEYLYNNRLLLSTQSQDSKLRNAIYGFFVHRSLPMIGNLDGKEAQGNIPLYGSFLLEKLNLELLISSCKDRSVDLPDFSGYYNHISKLDVGELRDQLMAISFLSFRKTRSNSMKYIDSAINSTEDWKYMHQLLELNNKEQEGRVFFDFSLVDSLGNIYQRKDLEEKLVIMDFWYTGCENCIKLKKAMLPFFEKYKKCPSVLFVTVSIDTDTMKWKKTLKRGLYTDSCETNLVTNGLGDADPLIRHYRISTYPTQFFILDGRMFNAVPPSPTNGTEFEKIIRTALDQLKNR